MGQVLLTFDTEDFISENSMWFLRSLLLCLKKYDSKALFFVTGHVAERLAGQTEIAGLLEEHEIGYHSSSHSVHPTIFEFTDIESYKEAYETALLRETSHINPLNGQIEGKGGIFAVRSLWSDKDVKAYRAPGFCWSPPHSEALRDLGLTFDFSSNIASSPVFYKGLTFYPYPVLREWQGHPSGYRIFLSSATRKKVTVICFHPSYFVNQTNWDSIYYKGNPKHVVCPRPRANSEFQSMFHRFELFIKRAKHIQDVGLIKLTTNLAKSRENIVITKDKVEEIYEHSMRWPRMFFGYEPKYLRNHFLKFFDPSFRTDERKCDLH